MDPDEMLRQILALAGQLGCFEPGQSIDQLTEQGLELAEKVNELDRWIMRGGFLPARWRGEA